MIANCPTSEELKSLSLGKLDEEQSDVLVLHLESCDTCQNELAQVDSNEDLLIAQLKSSAAEAEDSFSSADGYRVAMTRALAALASAPASSVPSSIPTAIGDYEIVRPLGHGGMGHVYLGKHTKLNRMVAIKFIADHRLWDQTMHERFESEMRLIGGLKHPNIVSAYDAREVDGLAVLVTEFIDGMTLSEILKRTGKIDVANASKIVADVCEALQYIQSKGLVHRDIKPSNIMIDQDGNVKLLDLGLARIEQSDEAATGFAASGAVGFTASGQAMGTADYIPPEQINDSRKVDIRADVYGLGCTFYKLLTGKAPFAEHASAFSKMNAHVAETPVSLKNNKLVPAKIAKLADKMLAKEPANRPQQPSDIASELQTYCADADLQELVLKAQAMPIRASAEPETTFEKPQPKGSFFSKIPWGALIATAAAGLFGIWLGVVITVKKPDGSMAMLEIPDGSTAVVDAEGNIEVRLAGSEKTSRIDKSNVEFPHGAIANRDDRSRSDFHFNSAEERRNTSRPGVRLPDEEKRLRALELEKRLRELYLEDQRSKSRPTETFRQAEAIRQVDRDNSGRRASSRALRGSTPAEIREMLMQQARDYEFHSLEIAGEPVELSFHDQSLLNWTNKPRGGDGGINVLWKDDGMPMAFGTLFRSGGSSIRHSLTSLSEHPLRGIYRGEGTWTPAPGIVWQEWKPEEVTIAKTEALRMVQMKDIAKQFEVLHEADGKIKALDLMPEPLYRFSSKKHGVVDGVVMAFADGTDSEALLLLRADENATTWKFACARCSWFGMTGTVNGQQVWKAKPVHVVDARGGDMRFLKSPYVSGSQPFERDSWVGFDAESIGVFTTTFDAFIKSKSRNERSRSNSSVPRKQSGMIIKQPDATKEVRRASRPSVSGVKRTYRIPPDSELYGKVEPGDEIDIFAADPKSADDYALHEKLLLTKVKLSHVSFNSFNTSTSTNSITLQSMRDVVKLDKLVKSDPKLLKNLRFRFHNPNSQLLFDRSRLNGVWKSVLMKIKGKILPSAPAFFYLFHKDECLSGVPGGHFVYDFQLEQGAIYLRNQTSEREFPFEYRFLESGRLELYEPTQKMSIRLQKIESPESQDEKTVFEILAKATENPEYIQAFIVEPAKASDPNSLLVYGTKDIVKRVGKPVINRNHILTAKVQNDNRGKPKLYIKLTPEGGARMALATKNSLTKKMGLMIEGKVKIAPTINAPISNALTITSNLERKELEEIASKLCVKLDVPEDQPTRETTPDRTTSSPKGDYKSPSTEKIRNLIFAMQVYEVEHHSFPASKCQGKKSGPPFSWRVALLPYLDHKDLYDQYKFDEPWDSEANSKVLKQMPDLFRHPSSPKDSTETGYVGVAGKHAVLGIEIPKGLPNFTDGSSNSIGVIELKSGIPWTKPDDLMLDSLQWESQAQFEKAFTKLPFFDTEKICVGCADGSVHCLDKEKLHADVKRAINEAPGWLNLFTVDDGTPVDVSDYLFSQQ